MQRPETSSGAPRAGQSRGERTAKSASPTPPPPSPDPNPARRNLLYCLLLAGLTLAVYWPVYRFDFLRYDDFKYLRENFQLQEGFTLGNIGWAFRTFYFENWHPVTWLSYLMDYQLFGLNPAAFHSVNLILHLLSTLLLFNVLRKMTGAAGPSAFVAAIFAVHPLHVESVAWVAERKDVLSGFFWMLTLWVYARYAQSPRLGKYLLALLFFAFGLMAKPMVVTLPFVLLLLDVWPLRRASWPAGLGTVTKGVNAAPGPAQFTWPRLLVEKVPFLILTAVSCVLTSLAQRGAMMTLHTLPLSQRIANALISYARYLGLTLCPHHLAIHYPHPGHWPFEALAGSVVLLAVVTIWVYLQRKKRPYLAVGWLWFLGTLVPVIGLVQVGGQSIADRYMYLPQIGLMIMLAWGASDAAAGWTDKRGLVIGAGAAVLGCLWVSSLQVRFWQNSKLVFEHALAVRPGRVAHNNLGDALLAEGRTNEAAAHYTAALQIDPNDIWGYVNFGNLLMNQGKIDEAIAKYRKGLELNPANPELNNNMGLCLTKQGKLSEAVHYYREAIRFAAKFDSETERADALLNLGNALEDLGQFDEAIVNYKTVLTCKPKASVAHLNIGNALGRQGKHQEAAEQYHEALQLQPNNEQAHAALGMSLSRQSKHAEAIAEFTQAVRLKPDDAEFHFNFATILDAAKKPAEAAAEYRESIRLKPDFVLALNNLAWLLATRDLPNLRNGAEAVNHAERACQITGNQQPFLLGTLAAAYAEAGRFTEAATTAQKAADLAAAKGQKEVAATNLKLLELYRGGKPYREAP